MGVRYGHGGFPFIGHLGWQVGVDDLVLALAGRVQRRHASVNGTGAPGPPTAARAVRREVTLDRGQVPGQCESRAAQARARLVCYLTARTSMSRMSGALASRSADTLASAAGIWPLMCAVRASSVAKVSKMP